MAPHVLRNKLILQCLFLVAFCLPPVYPYPLLAIASVLANLLARTALT
jgi:hypothetical protein